MGGSLDGLRVVECGEFVSAPYGAKLFADLGAEVIKVELPAGDPCRARPPLTPHSDSGAVGALFLYLNQNKRSVTVDLTARDGRAALRRILRDADLLIHNYPPARADACGLRYDALAEWNPRLVVTSISGFGRSGPRRDYASCNLIAVHAGGWASISPGSLDDPRLPPLAAFGSQADFVAGSAAAVASLGAIWAAQTDGLREEIDVSTQECVCNVLEGALNQYLYTGNVSSRLAPWRSGWLEPLPCERGAVVITAYDASQWDRLVEAMGNPEWASWPVFATAELRAQNSDVLVPLVIEWTQRHDRDALLALLQRHRVPAAPYQTVPEVLEMEQLRGRDYFVPEPTSGFLQPSAPYKLAATPWRLRTPAPTLGQHNDALFDADPWPEAPPVAQPGAGQAADERRLPLTGVRVVEFTWAWAGPMCGLQLAQLGAEVIKIESRARLDLTRTGPQAEPGTSPNVRWNFNTFNQDKRSVTIDITTAEGQDLGRRLVAISDVVIENLRPGVLARFGLDYPALRREHPGLIMISLSGFGATGPFARRPAFGVPLVFAGGLASLTGYPSGGPRSVGVSYPDPVSGLHGAFAVLSALRHRRRTGEGQAIDLSELECTIGLLPEGFLPVTLGGEQPPRMGNRDPVWAPHGCYRCRGEDRWVAIAVRDQGEWGRFCAAIGRPTLADDPRFATTHNRKTHEDDLDAAIERWTAPRDRWEVTRALQGHGVPAIPTMTVADLAADEHLAARGYFSTAEHPEVPGTRHPGVPWRATRTNDRFRGPAPQLGEANGYVWRDLLGLRDAEITALAAAGAIH